MTEDSSILGKVNEYHILKADTAVRRNICLSRGKNLQYLLVLGRDPTSPKARTFKVKPDKPEPEVCWNLQARGYPKVISVDTDLPKKGDFP